MNIGKTVRFAQWTPAAALLLALSPYLTRQLWFDEALTVLNFACLGGPGEIYRAYVIPNNHILYTVVLYYWLKLLPPGFAPDLWLRLPSVVFAVVLLGYLGRRFRRMCGAIPLAVVLTALAVSPPFLVFATAVRGYMLGALFCAWAAGSAAEFAASPRFRPFAKYFIAALGAVLTVPSDLAALAGVVLFALPWCGAKFWNERKFYVLALTPVAALLLAYLPISRNFIAVAQLGEGWRDRWSSLAAVGLALASAFGALLLLLPAEWVRGVKRWRRELWRAAIWFLPLPAAFVFAVAPFPRVYFPLFPLLALAVAGALRSFAGVNWHRKVERSIRIKLGIGFVVLLLSLLPWHLPVLGALSPHVGGDLGDDFFYGYHLRPEHQPVRVAQALEKLPARSVYFSFLSDPWANMFYHLTRGGKAEYLFDGPRGQVAEIPVGAAAVLRRDESPEVLGRRFGRKLRQVSETPACNIFIVEAL